MGTKPATDSYTESVRATGAKKGDILEGVVGQAKGMVIEILYDVPVGTKTIGVCPTGFDSNAKYGFKVKEKNTLMSNLTIEKTVYDYESARAEVGKAVPKFEFGFETRKYKVKA